MKLLPFPVERRLRGLKFRLSRKLPGRQPAEIWPGIDTTAVTLRPFAGQFGNVKRYELLILCAVARQFQAKTLFEFGTFDGLTAWHLAANAAPTACLWTLDLPLNHPSRFYRGHDRTVGRIYQVSVGRHFLGTPEGGRIEQLFADSLEFNSEPFRDKIDFCFIDASHEYHHVSRDTANALLMVRPGGVIFWHDYSRWWPGVQKCLDELSAEYPVVAIAETSLAVLRVPEKRFPDEGPASTGR